jgi:hypothetical protein
VVQLFSLGGTMFTKPHNKKLAVSALLLVMVLDVALANLHGGGVIISWLIINFLGFLLISFIGLVCRFTESSGAGVFLVPVACLFSAIFWSFIFGYVFPLKRAA